MRQLKWALCSDFREALFRTRTGDPLLTIERQGGKRGHGREAAGTKAAQEEGIVRRRLTARARLCPNRRSLSVPSSWLPVSPRSADDSVGYLYRRRLHQDDVAPPG